MKSSRGVISALFILYLPFLSQAFHIDDPLFIAVAEQILKDPWHPYAFSINWVGTEMPIDRFFANPPLHGYFLAAGMKLLGRQEWALHLWSFLWVLLGVQIFGRLARRFQVSPHYAALLIFVAPAAMVMSHTVMPDVALMVASTAAVVCFIEGWDGGGRKKFICAGLWAGTAILLRYSGLTTLGLFLAYAFLSSPKDRSYWIKSVPAFIVPLIFWGRGSGSASCSMDRCTGSARARLSACFLRLWERIIWLFVFLRCSTTSEVRCCFRWPGWRSVSVPTKAENKISYTCYLR